MSELNPFYIVDEFGYLFDENKQKITDQEKIEDFFDNLKIDDNFCILSRVNSENIIVEAFDMPIVVQSINLNEVVSKQKQQIITNCYDLNWKFDLSSIKVDEWDRFYGFTTKGLPFVLSPAAQHQLFDQLDEFTDDSLIFNNVEFPVESYWPDIATVENEQYWNERYQHHEDGWDLGAPAAALVEMLPKLKLPSSRILVLGGGGGHDAAFFAQQGHHVTLIDISSEAINKARTSYGHLKQIQFIQSDIFDLPSEMYGQFDIVFEHTCFCAINPRHRQNLVQQWKRLLCDDGHLFGIFFVMPKRTGPPFGSSEWELRQRLQKSFRTLYWHRYRQSIKPRLGREHFIYAQKLSLK